ncbi:hypothetical protein [Streptomyces sp. NPDC015350]|uniref:hypothetical protein n=1 Tax=Streptomyces sp. NPDC015350 TaxID=3364955 RepID=UPI0036FA2998
MDTDEITLVHHGFPKPKYVRLRVDGDSLRRESRSGESGRPRHSAKDCGSPTEAGYALAKETRKRLHDGFVMLRDPAEAAVGEPVLVAAAPNHCSSQVLDVHPEGHTLVVGTTLKGAYGAEIHLVDVATGVRRLVHTEPAGERQTFVHTVRFDAAGQGVVHALNGETRHLDLATGTSRTLASYEQWQTSDFNPFCVQPSWDRDRARLLVFDAGNRARVLDAAGAPLLDLDVARQPECRAGALSPSGRLLALAFGTGPAHVEVWDVDTGRQAQRHGFPFPYLDPERRGRLRRRGGARFRPDGAAPDRQRGFCRRPVRHGTRHGRVGVGGPRSVPVDAPGAVPDRPVGHVLRLDVLPRRHPSRGRRPRHGRTARPRHRHRTP